MLFPANLDIYVLNLMCQFGIHMKMGLALDGSFQQFVNHSSFALFENGINLQ